MTRAEGNGRRWTDEKIDDLASSVSELRESVSGLQVTAQALLQVAAQQQRNEEARREEFAQLKQRQVESDQRFEILLAEVRHLIGKLDRH